MKTNNIYMGVDVCTEASELAADDDGEGWDL
jgi:hypothetical protein